MKTYIILIVCSLIICTFIYFSKEYEIAKLNEENKTHHQIERAAIQNFSSVDTFIKLFPRAHYRDGSFIALPSDFKENIYACKLPTFTILENRVTFNGTPTFESSALILQAQSMSFGNKKTLNIDEIGKEILKSQNDH